MSARSARSRHGSGSSRCIAAAISVATHKATVFIDLSGWLPKNLPPAMLRALARQV